MNELPEKMTFAQTRACLAMIAEHGDEYAGLPCSISGVKIHVHPSYRFAEVFNKTAVDLEGDDVVTVVNDWRSYSGKGHCIIFRQGGKILGTRLYDVTAGSLAMNTMGIAPAWDIAAEAKAIQKLATLLSAHAFKTYMLTGMFLETSKRSRITYLFRRLRPTVAMSTSGNTVTILCGLCLHPIGYYEGTWAGVMVPTDEVISHLMLMRGDEHNFWKQANQHPSHAPEAGI